MFEVNSYMLNRLGWVNYSQSRGIGLGPQIFADDPLVRYFILFKEKSICFILKELTEEEKQKTKNSYKFIKLDYADMNSPKFTINELNSNEKLFRLVIENEAISSKTHLRDIKLNKIIK